MTLLDRIKQAYKKTDTQLDREDCYQPLKVLFKSQFGIEPTEETLQTWMSDMVFDNDETVEGFLVGFGCKIPSPPSNDHRFAEGFYTARSLIRELSN